MEWDAESRTIAERYAGEDWDKPREIERDPFYSSFDHSWPLDGFIAMLQGIMDEVPEAYRSTAEFAYVPGRYDEGDHIQVTHRDMETPEEVADRVASCWAHVVERRAREKADYERLKAKFA